MTSFRGKTVLITGACGAVGSACVDAFLLKGANVFATDRIPPSPALASRSNVFFQSADVTNQQAVAVAYETASQRFGRIDAAVLCAGIEGVVASVEEISERDIDEVLAVNVKGCLFWMQQCLRGMKGQKDGSIVALSSISGVVGSSLLAGYAMSKHAVIGLVKSAALEAGPHNVRVNAVCPGPIQSAMMHRLDKAFLERDPHRFVGKSDAAKAIPLQRYVTAIEVAHMITFLCGDESLSCHGGVYMVDGGFTAK